MSASQNFDIPFIDFCQAPDHQKVSVARIPSQSADITSPPQATRIAPFDTHRPVCRTDHRWTWPDGGESRDV